MDNQTKLFTSLMEQGPDMGIVPALVAVSTQTHFDHWLSKRRSAQYSSMRREGTQINTFPINTTKKQGPVTTLCISGDARFLAADPEKIDIFE